MVYSKNNLSNFHSVLNEVIVKSGTVRLQLKNKKVLLNDNEMHGRKTVCAMCIVTTLHVRSILRGFHINLGAMGLKVYITYVCKSEI